LTTIEILKYFLKKEKIMKKTLLLTSLVASMVAIAGTTGSVKSFAESEAEFKTTKSVSDDQKEVKTNTTKSYKVGKIGVETEVKVKGSGLSFGGTFQAKDLELGKVTEVNYLNHSSVWAKYELPEIKGVKSYVKATVSPKLYNVTENIAVPTLEKAKEEVKKLYKDNEKDTAVKNKLADIAKKEGMSDEKVNAIKNANSKDTAVELLANDRIDALKAKNAEHKTLDKGSAELEGQVSYKYGDFTFGLNSKTNFPLSGKDYYTTLGNNNIVTYHYVNVEDYGKLVKSTHKVFVESEEGKDVFVKGLKDVKANVEVKHDYRKLAKNEKAGARVDYVSGEVSAKYDAVKDLALEGKVAFKKNIKSGEKIGDYEVIGTKLFKEVPANYIHSYELKETYTGVKHLTLSAKPFVAHVNLYKTVVANKLKRADVVLYGVELGAEYKMLNDKLTLTGKSLLAGIHGKKIDETKDDVAQKLVKGNSGVFVFDANAKYDYSVTDKFTVSPEANANLELHVFKLGKDVVTKPELTLTPKVSAKYVPVEGLTIEGVVSVPVKFGVVKSFEKDTTGKYTKEVKGFGYDSTSIKTSLNLKYEWK